MADIPSSGGAADRQTVELLRETDVAYWCQIFGVAPAHLREAVQHAGSAAVDVSRYLRDKGYAGKD